MTLYPRFPQIPGRVISALGLGLALLLSPALTDRAEAQAAAVGYYGPYRPITFGYTPFEPAGFSYIINYGPVFADSWRHIPPAVLTTEERLMIQQQSFMAQVGQQQALANETANMFQLDAITRRAPDPFKLPEPEAEAAPAPEPPVEARKSLADLFDESGQLLWPVTTPADADLNPRREDVQQAAQLVNQQALQSGNADVDNVREAREKLHRYGRPILKRLSARGDRRRHDAMLTFLHTLDLAMIEKVQVPDEADAGQREPEED